MKRRQLLAGAGLQAGVVGCGALSRFAWAQPTDRRQGARELTFGTTAVFLDDQAGFLSRWSAYLSGAVGVPVRFVQRRAYRDIMGLLLSQEVDAAWICGYPWVVNQSHLRGLSIPIYEDPPWYRSYLIVPASDTTTRHVRDLRGRVYAFSDPDSNSGHLVPRTTLIRDGLHPDRHFSRSFFTWGHRNVVNAVAEGLADGGSVDGYVWDTLKLIVPSLVQQTRVAWRSDRYGFPPVVVRSGLSAEGERQLRQALFGMSGNEAGRELLGQLNLSGFGPFQPRAFDGIAELVALNARGISR
ncbi:substrate-binding domain-containing protein [Ideonella sp. BN130291]|uniref:substrate-binding domain-containing protein n=1 Tax=Ideonella sp. BN130291 TaxID=3112940 RepID=UPI002E25D4E7|nr:PhnD/SsuA/transferrin family substrate-binding protein [Ideonella sp. BN130291]